MSDAVAPNAGNRLTPRQYQAKWMAAYQQHRDPARTDATNTVAPEVTCAGGAVAPIGGDWSLPGPRALIDANPGALDDPTTTIPPGTGASPKAPPSTPCAAAPSPPSATGPTTGGPPAAAPAVAPTARAAAPASPSSTTAERDGPNATVAGSRPHPVPPSPPGNRSCGQATPADPAPPTSTSRSASTASSAARNPSAPASTRTPSASSRLHCHASYAASEDWTPPAPLQVARFVSLHPSSVASDRGGCWRPRCLAHGPAAFGVHRAAWVDEHGSLTFSLG